MRKDVCDLGVLMLQMVTGREDVEVERRGGVLVGEADERAGEWPVEVAVRFGVVGARCVQVGGVAMGMEEVLREMEEVRRMAVAWRQHWCDGYGRDRDRDDEMDGSDVPSVFVCPILQVLSLTLSLSRALAGLARIWVGPMLEVLNLHPIQGQLTI